MAVAYEELEGSPTWQGGNGVLTAQRIFKVAWADRFEFYNNLWGRWYSVGGVVVHTSPATFPGIPLLVVDNVTTDPFDPASPLGSTALTSANLSSESNDYEAARVTVTYAPLQNSGPPTGSITIPDGTLLSIQTDISAERENTPGRTWRWDVGGDSLEEDSNVGLFVVCQDFSAAWTRVINPPWANIRSIAGKVNDAEFLGCPIGTVLFLGCRSSNEWLVVDTDPFWKLEYHFQHKIIYSTVDGSELDNSWNRKYRPKGSPGGEKWLEIEDENGDPPFIAADFPDLFVQS